MRKRCGGPRPAQGHGKGSSGKALVDLIDGLVPPADDRFPFVLCREAGRGRTGPTKGADLLALPPAEINAAAYWTEGMVPPAAQRQCAAAR